MAQRDPSGSSSAAVHPHASALKPPSRAARWRHAVSEFLSEMGRSSPARLLLLVFTAMIGVFTALLSLPIAAAEGQRTPFVDALFTRSPRSA